MQTSCKTFHYCFWEIFHWRAEEYHNVYFPSLLPLFSTLFLIGYAKRQTKLNGGEIQSRTAADSLASTPGLNGDKAATTGLLLRLPVSRITGQWCMLLICQRVRHKRPSGWMGGTEGGALDFTLLFPLAVKPFDV